MAAHPRPSLCLIALHLDLERDAAAYESPVQLEQQDVALLYRLERMKL